MMINEEGLMCCVRRDRVQVVVPKEMRALVLARVHGSRSVGHWGLARTALFVARRYWWKTWLSDVQKHVESCFPCQLKGLRRPAPRNARMVKYTPSQRFGLFALDVTEISPRGGNGERKVVVIGDVKTRVNVAVPVKDEQATTIAVVLWDVGLQVLGRRRHC
jgi:Integrase zinc binding domain